MHIHHVGHFTIGTALSYTQIQSVGGTVRVQCFRMNGTYTIYSFCMASHNTSPIIRLATK